MVYKNSLAVAFVLCLGMTACGEKPTKDKSVSTTSTRVTLPSGLGYEVLRAAPEGAEMPPLGSKVSVHYTGWLEGKSEAEAFDSSVKRGFPFEFVLSKPGYGQVIKGWDEGVALMKVGEKRRLILPSDLGYGARGAGALIPGGATLVFDVELLSFKKPQAA